MTKILIVHGRFYDAIADELAKGARAALDKAGVAYDEITVPGAFEIPAAIRFALETNRYEGFVALGCVIRGETSHYDYVCGESARGLMELALQHKAAIGYGILTVETLGQAQVRADVNEGNKGGEAVAACLRLVALKNQFGAA